MDENDQTEAFKEEGKKAQTLKRSETKYRYTFLKEEIAEWQKYKCGLASCSRKAGVFTETAQTEAEKLLMVDIKRRNQWFFGKRGRHSSHEHESS